MIVSTSASARPGRNQISNEDVWHLLASEEMSGESLIQLLSKDRELKILFEGSAGVSEGYTVKEHTLRVFKLFEEQRKVFPLRYQFTLPDDIRVWETLRIAIALHDIGKPLALRAGDKDRQHEFTVPILLSHLNRLGFTEREARLAEALVGHDIVGELSKGLISLDEARVSLRALARAAQLPDAVFLPLQALFFVSDAGSYPYLRSRVFTFEGRVLMPKAPGLSELLRHLRLL